jgi:nucleotide-binding universal stress UspA family protein
MSIVIGYVPTPEGLAALDYAIAEAGKSGRRLVVVNSSKGDALVDSRFAGDSEMASIDERLKSQGIDHLVLHPVRGQDATTEVLDAADKHQASLIIIGLRRRSPVGKLFLGSTAQRILLEADCPVLAVKAASA